MGKSKKKSITKATIRIDLIKQITLKRANIDLFISMIDDYLSLWDIKNELISDIHDNGSVLTFYDPEIKKTVRAKNNPSVKELVGVSKQMLSMLKEIGLTTSNVGGDEDDDDL